LLLLAVLDADKSRAYAVGPLTYAGWIVRRFGYRWSFITGLCIFGIGTLLFWPSAKFSSFGGFCGSSFVVGSGLSTLEASAIPFVAICGPPKYSEIRLNLAQAFQSTAAVAALVLASYIILDDTPPKDAPLGGQTSSLDTIQWLYLGIATFIFLLAFGLYFAPIPEITDEDLQEQTHQTAEEHGDNTYEDQPLGKQYKLFFGVFASFCFTGSQVSVATFFINYAVEVNPALSDKDAAHRLAVAQAVFAAGRFAASVILIKVKARHLLLGSVTLVVAFLGTAIGAEGDAGIAMIILEFCAKSCVFPTMFTLTLRGLRRHTKRGASWLVASIASGIVFAPAMGAAADAMGTQKALVVPLVAMAAAASYSLYLNLFQSKELDEDWALDEPAGQSESSDDMEMVPKAQRTEEQELIQEGFEKFCK